jgi:DNA-binding transcriptional LysR family regulator
MLGAAIDGAGIIYTMESAIEKEIKSGKLEVVLGQYAATSAGFYLYYPKRSQVQPKLRVFIEHLKDWGVEGGKR